MREQRGGGTTKCWDLFSVAGGGGGGEGDILSVVQSLFPYASQIQTYRGGALLHVIQREETKDDDVRSHSALRGFANQMSEARPHLLVCLDFSMLHLTFKLTMRKNVPQSHRNISIVLNCQL